MSETATPMVMAAAGVHDSVVRFVGCVNLIVFFVADFFFAFVLHKLKQDHPVIDDCAPDHGSRDVDTIAVLSFMNNPTAASAAGSIFGGGGDDATPSDPYASRQDYSPKREDLIHKLVMAASFCAPIFSFLQVVSPSTLSWSQFSVPVWLGYMTMVPGLGVVMFYASRATRVSHFTEVSKAQWLSMMWFRLDVICVMATLLLLGWGDWLVAMCLYAVALYLAHRLMVTERRLVSVTTKTQLVREELGDSHGEEAGGGGGPQGAGGYGSGMKAAAPGPSLKGYDSIGRK